MKKHTPNRRVRARGLVVGALTLPPMMLLPLPSAVASGLSPAQAHEATASESSVPTVAYIDPASTNPYQIAFQCGIVQNAKAYGLKLVDIATNGTFTPQGQIPLLLAAAAKNPDVLITQPTSPTAITPTLKQVVAHGTKVVIYGQDLTDTSVASALVNQDNFGGGVALAKIVAKQTGGVGQALVIDYQPASGTSSERISGFISVMKKYPHFKLYGPFYDNYEASNDASILDAAIAAHPGLTMVVPSYNQAAENVVAALKAVGKAKKIKVYSFDGNPQEIQAVRAGDISVLLSEQVQAEAKATLSLAHSIAEGKKVPYLTNFPYVTITPQDINTPQAKGGFYGTKECM